MNNKLYKEEIEINFSNVMDFDKVGHCNINKNGDFLHRIYIKIVLPKINAYVKNLTIHDIQQIISNYNIKWNSNKPHNSIVTVEDITNINRIIDNKINKLSAAENNYERIKTVLNGLYSSSNKNPIYLTNYKKIKDLLIDKMYGSDSEIANILKYKKHYVHSILTELDCILNNYVIQFNKNYKYSIKQGPLNAYFIDDLNRDNKIVLTDYKIRSYLDNYNIKNLNSLWITMIDSIYKNLNDKSLEPYYKKIRKTIIDKINNNNKNKGYIIINRDNCTINDKTIPEYIIEEYKKISNNSILIDSFYKDYEEIPDYNKKKKIDDCTIISIWNIIFNRLVNNYNYYVNKLDPKFDYFRNTNGINYIKNIKRQLEHQHNKYSNYSKIDTGKLDNLDGLTFEDSISMLEYIGAPDKFIRHVRKRQPSFTLTDVLNIVYYTFKRSIKKEKNKEYSLQILLDDILAGIKLDSPKTDNEVYGYLLKHLETYDNNNCLFLENMFELKEVIQETEDNISGSSINFAWIKKLGYNLIDYCYIQIDDKVIDTLYGSWLDIWDQLTVPRNKQYIHNNLIGNTNDLHNYDNNTKHSKTLYIPLHFWFCRDISRSLPLHALKNSDIKLFLKLKSFNSVTVYDNDITVFKKKPKINTSLLAEYITMDDKTNLDSKVKYNIDTVQYVGKFSGNLDKLQMSITNDRPIKEFIWNVDRSDFLEKIRIKVGNKVIEEWKDKKYYNYIQPLYHHTSCPDDGVYVYSFALEPESLLSTGSFISDSDSNTNIVLKVNNSAIVCSLYILKSETFGTVDGKVVLYDR